MKEQFLKIFELFTSGTWQNNPDIAQELDREIESLENHTDFNKSWKREIVMREIGTFKYHHVDGVIFVNFYRRMIREAIRTPARYKNLKVSVQ